MLIAPTGGGKPLAGFLPSLVDLHQSPTNGLHTLYVSPLKALSVDIHRNLSAPVSEMGLNISLDTRTGDTLSRRGNASDASRQIFCLLRQKACRYC